MAAFNRPIRTNMIVAEDRLVTNCVCTKKIELKNKDLNETLKEMQQKIDNLTNALKNVDSSSKSNPKTSTQKLPIDINTKNVKEGMALLWSEEKKKFIPSTIFED